MTLDKLIKRLQELRKTAGGRIAITMNAQEAMESCNGVYSILDVNGAYWDAVPQVDGDGFAIENKDGSQRLRRAILLSVYERTEAPEGSEAHDRNGKAIKRGL